MLFPSVIFLFYFFPIVLMFYYVFSFSRTIQNFILFISSIIFYAFGEPKYVILIIISIIINYFFGIFISKSNNKISKILLILSCIANLSILFVFKYLTFVLYSVKSAFGLENMIIPRILIPIGISFFTFQAMSYVIDVYKGTAKVQKNILNLGLYIVLFPQLIAGPIVRYSTFEDQIKNRKETLRKFSVGCTRFIIGLSKKVIISNTMAIIADRIFSMSAEGSIPLSLAWLGSISYSFQIFYDFAGYSDMAIGLGLIFGFTFSENFNYPYVSKSISEFWRRWHISLGTWFRDYVYFPLGGSRVKNKDKIIRNLFIVWILTGVWHGAEWTFIVWGILHFVFISFEKVISFEKLNIEPIFKHIYTLFIINFSWVLFRAGDLKQAGLYIHSMFNFISNDIWSSYTYMFIKENIIIFIFAILFSMPIAKRANFLIVNKYKGYKVFEFLYPVAIMMIFLVSISYIVKGTYNPFIYFNF